jgi:DNA adenine methylase
MDISLLRYPGGKSRAVKIITEFFPKNLSLLCSPFFGGGSIEFYLSSKGVKVYGYDIFKPLIVFWNCVKNNKIQLIKEVKKLYPMSKEKFKELQKKLLYIDDPIQQAATFYALNRCSFSGTTLSGGMSPGHPRFNLSSINRLEKFNIYDVDFEVLDFRESIHKHKNDFLYLDPPYYIESNLYGNKGDLHKNFDHIALYEILKNRSNWILSYNNVDMIKDLYRGYEIVYPKWGYGLGKDKKSREILVINY